MKHLYNHLKDKSFDVLFEENFRLNGNHPTARLLKIRARSCGGNAKSEGFRAIVFLNKSTQEYIFLDVYPKAGPMAKSNMKKTERKECLEELKKERNNLLKLKLITSSKSLEFDLK